MKQNSNKNFFNQAMFFSFLFSTFALSANDNLDLKKRADAEQDLISRIDFFNAVKPSNLRPYDYGFTVGTKREGCSVSQNLQLHTYHQAMIDAFFTTNPFMQARASLTGEEKLVLNIIIRDGFNEAFRGVAGSECQIHISTVFAHGKFLNSIFNRGLKIQVTSSLMSLLKPRLLKLAETNELVEFLSKLTLVYDVLKVTEPSLKADPSLALFLVSKTYESYHKDPNANEMKKLALSYRHFKAVQEFTRTQGGSNTLSILNSYMTLVLMERASGNKEKIAQMEAINVNAYLGVMTRLAEMFPDLQNSTASGNVFDKIYAGEALANTVDSEKIGNRLWLIGFVPVVSSHEEYKRDFEIVRKEVVSHLLRQSKDKYTTVAGKLRFSAHVLRLASDVMSAVNVNNESEYIVEVRKSLIRQVDIGVAMPRIKIPQKNEKI